MRLILPALLLTLLPLSAHALTAAEKGLAIATEAQQRDDGFGDSKASLKMILTNRHGDESVRYLRIKTLEVLGDGDKSMSIFDRPADVKGTALLTFSHKTGIDDQWLYLPALKRVKRIASRNKSGSFMGSEFAYEDLSSQEVEKYTYKFLREEPCNGLECFVVERYPVDKLSGYTRQIAWLDKAEYRWQKVEFYDRKNVLLKTLTYIKLKQYLNQYWRADEMYMENHQTGKATRLIWSDYKFRNGFTERDFDRNGLKRAR